MIEVPMSAALAIAFGSTSRTFGADEVVVRRVLADLTGKPAPEHGPALSVAMWRCAGHVAAQMPTALRVCDPPPDFTAGDVADYCYLARATTLYGATLSMRPLPEMRVDA